MVNDFRLLSLEEAGVEVIDCDHRTPKRSQVGRPYVTIPEMHDGRINLESARLISEEDFTLWTRKALPQPNDVVLSRRTNPGETALVRDGQTFALGQNLVLLRSDGTTIAPEFLFWLTQGPRWWREVDKYLNVGAIFDSLRIPDIRRFEVPVPPYDTQIAISRVLACFQDKIELNRQIIETLEEFSRELYRAWFVDFSAGPAASQVVGALPDGWLSGSLAYISEINPESWKTRSAPGAVEYLDLSNVKWGHVLGTVSYTWDEAPSRARRILRSGDTIVGTVRPGNGSYALISYDGLTGSTGFAVLRPKSQSTRALTYLAATDPSNIARLAHLADGAAYPAVRPALVYESPVTVPDQNTLLAFSNAVDPLLDRAAICEVENETLGALRDALLPKLISGELHIPEAEQLVSEVA